MNIKTKKLEDLIPADYNPRTISSHAMAALTASVERFGLVQPIIWNESTGNVVSGHQRLQVLKQQGIKATKVVVVTLGEEDEKALNITQNNQALSGEYTDGLQDLLEDIKEFDMFDELCLGDLIMEVELDPIKEDTEADLEPDGNAEPICKPGDLWQLGDHRLLCGSSTVITDVEKLMDGKLADMVFTDPPYGVNYVGGTKDALTIQNDNPEDVPELADAFMNNLMVVTKKGACWYVTIPAGNVGLPFTNKMNELEVFRQELIWNKSSMVMGHSDYHYKHEPVLYGWTPGAAHLAPPDRTQTSVWDIDKPQRNGEHPTMKPLALMEKAMLNSTKRNQTVIDLFGGSGSTLIVCEQLSRKCCMMELDPKYCDVIINRWQKLTGNVAELVEDLPFD